MVKIKFSGGSVDYFTNPYLNYTNYKSNYSGFNDSNKYLLNNLQNKNTLHSYDNGITGATQLLKNSIKNNFNNLSKKLLGGADVNNIVKQFTYFMKKYFIFIIFFVLLLVYIIFRIINSNWFISKKHLNLLDTYSKKVNIKPILSCSTKSLGAIEYRNIKNLEGIPITPKKLSNFYVASSNSSCTVGGEYGWVSIDALKKILQAGARLLDFDIFNSVYGENAEPIVANGIEKGQVIHSKNTLKFDDIAKVIIEYAFSDNYVSNYTDPLFLNFNIKVENNFYTLNKLADIIYKHMDGFLLPKKYSYQKQIIGNSPIDELSNKIIIFADKDFENSRFNELVNSSSQKNFMRILDFKKDVEGTYDHDKLIDFNKKYISICKPLNPSQNYDPFIGWVYGCQFVCMNYSIENHMDEYIDNFNESSFKFKPFKLRWHPLTIDNPPPQDKRLSFKTIKVSTPFYTASI